MQTWILRSLHDAEYEKLAFTREFVAIGWAETGDLTNMSNEQQIQQAVRAGYPFIERASVASYAEQLLSFRKKMVQDDIVLLFCRSSPDVAVGRIIGDYQYRNDISDKIRHVRPALWIRRDIPRALVERELISPPALTMVHRIDSDAEVDRIQELIAQDDSYTTAEPNVGPTVPAERTPYLDLRRNLNYARSLATAGQHLAQLEVGAFEVSDVFRAAWVQGIAGLDHWVRQEVRLRLQHLAQQQAGNKPRGFSSFPIPIGEIERVFRSDTSFIQVIDEQFTQVRGHQTYQHPDKIREVLLLVSDVKDLWGKVAKILSESSDEGTRYRGNDVRARLVDIVRRRNKIAHEYDSDPSNPSAKLPIDAAMVVQMIDWIEQLASAILVVLDAPAPHASLPPGSISDG